MDKLKLIEAILSEAGTFVCEGEVGNRTPWKVGDKLYMRGVTYHNLGRVKKIVGTWVELEDAVWVACSKRWMETMTTGELDEVEPHKTRCWVNSEACVDVEEWQFDLPTEQK